MNINAGLQNIKEQVLVALMSNKETLIKEYYNILKVASTLLNTDDLNYWQNQLRQHKWELFPTTKIGVSQELINWQKYQLSLDTFFYRLLDTSEHILVYHIEDDLCETQGQYYYYKDDNLDKVFKESEHGYLSGIELSEIDWSVKPSIALIPDLEKLEILNPNDLYF